MARSKSRTGKSSPNNSEATSAELIAAKSVVSGDDSGISRSGPEMVKSSPKLNVVPFSLEEEIRRRAYELYKQRGPSSGSETDDWLVAEREILGRYQEHRA